MRFVVAAFVACLVLTCDLNVSSFQQISTSERPRRKAKPHRASSRCSSCSSQACRRSSRLARVPESHLSSRRAMRHRPPRSRRCPSPTGSATRCAEAAEASRIPVAFFARAVLAGKPLPLQRGQPRRRTGRRAVHAGHGRRSRPRRSLRSDEGDAGLGKVAEQAA